MKQKKWATTASLFGAALASLLVAPELQADVVINNTGITDPAQTLTFSELSFETGTPITDQFSGFGVTFSPSMFYNVQPLFFPTDFLASFDLKGTQNNVSIFFSKDVTGAALALQSNPEDTTFTALYNGVVVETFTTLTQLSFLPDLTHASDFYGFENIVFDELRIENASEIFQIDNLQYTFVPGPFSGALLGLAALCGTRRRRR